MSDVNLILVRHATAEDHADSGRDADRKLSELGRQQARALARGAAALGIPRADAILTSGFRRADETRQAFDWLKGEDYRDAGLSPYGRPAEAGDVVRGYVAAGQSVIWVFSHNPFLTGFLREFAPRVLDVIGKVRKSDLVWLRWRSAGDCLHRHPDLKGFLSKPRIDQVDLGGPV